MTTEYQLASKAKNLNETGAFSGEIVNRGNIGKTSADLKALWNTEHPEDLIP